MATATTTAWVVQYRLMGEGDAWRDLAEYSDPAVAAEVVDGAIDDDREASQWGTTMSRLARLREYRVYERAVW